MNSKPIIELRDVSIEFRTRMGPVKVADHVSFDINEGQTFCLLGESGCGKSVIALSIPGLLPENAVVTGQILYRGADLLAMNPKELKKNRGSRIAVIFEQPMSCLNPVMKIGEQIAETLRANAGIQGKAARTKAEQLMEEVGIPKRRITDFPHELSGGMQQRVMIAIALACNPELLIADEPTTALDLTVQRQILDLLKGLKDRYGTSLLIITHDLGVAAEMSDMVGVMYAGTLMEYGPVLDFFQNPGHPYSTALLNVISGKTLTPIPGSVPSLTRLPSGCPFHLRCEKAKGICTRQKPDPVFNATRMERCYVAGYHHSRKTYQGIQA